MVELDLLLKILGAIGITLLTFVLGYVGWVWRRLHAKVEDSISRTEVSALLAEKEAQITKEIISVKEDTRSMAESVVTAVKSLEDRLDKLMLHLMNQRNDK